MHEPTNHQHLKRSISLPFITLYGIGTIIGAGIYVLTGKVASVSGMQAPFAFILSALIATFTGLSYSELSSRYPKSAGEAVYVLHGFRSKGFSSLIGWMVIATGVVSASAITLGFVGYFKIFFSFPDWAIIVGVVCSMCFIASIGVNVSVGVASAITILEVCGLIYIISLAGGSLATLPDRWLEIIPSFTTTDFSNVFLGAFLAFYAFIGFEDMVNMAEEVKEPQRTLPKGIMLALVISGLLYFLVSLISVLALPIEELNSSEAPLADLVASNGLSSVNFIGIIGMIAVINGALIQVIMASRVLYGMGEQGIGPKSLSYVNSWTQTPVTATFLVSAIVLTLALWFPIVTLAKITTLIILFVFSTVNLSLIIIKLRTKTAPKDVVTFPIAIPMIGLFLNSILIGVQIYKWLSY
ncbi:MAG: amino acid permease [Chlamydiota bacterium]